MMKKWLEKIAPYGGFKRNVLTLMTGTVIAQGMLVLASPILTRIYTPNDFGVLGLFVSILTVFTAISCLRYELAIVLPQKDEQAINILTICFIIVIGMSLLVLIAVINFGDFIVNIFSCNEMLPYLWLMPIGIFFTGSFKALNYWYTRKKFFKNLAIARMGRSVGTISGQISAGTLLNIGSSGLIGGHVLGYAMSTFLLGFRFLRNEIRTIKSSIVINEIKNQLVRHKKFPLYSSWSALLNTLSQMLPVFLLGFFLHLQ